MYYGGDNNDYELSGGRVEYLHSACMRCSAGALAIRRESTYQRRFLKGYLDFWQMLEHWRMGIISFKALFVKIFVSL